MAQKRAVAQDFLSALPLEEVTVMAQKRPESIDKNEELGKQPTQSASNSIMTNISTDESTQYADPDSLTKKQEADATSDITGGNSNGSLTNKEFAKMIGQEISIQLVPALQNIDKNTKKGASASSAVAANTQ